MHQAQEIEPVFSVRYDLHRAEGKRLKEEMEEVEACGMSVCDSLMWSETRRSILRDGRWPQDARRR